MYERTVNNRKHLESSANMAHQKEAKRVDPITFSANSFTIWKQCEPSRRQACMKETRYFFNARKVTHPERKGAVRRQGIQVSL
ncbi:hypothetical protein TN98_17735 [Pantoea anthophila]|nr:hypothetical protein TN98_17735 [Pantoea anthophila]